MWGEFYNAREDHTDYEPPNPEQTQGSYKILAVSGARSNFLVVHRRYQEYEIPLEFISYDGETLSYPLMRLTMPPSRYKTDYAPPGYSGEESDEYFLELAEWDGVVFKLNNQVISLPAEERQCHFPIGEVTLLPVEIAVDANRDGLVEFGRDTTTAEKPFRFWINNDDDSNNEEHPDSSQKDSDDNEIQSMRDLEDFTRLHLHIGGLHDAIKDGSIEVGLEWQETGGTQPEIKLYRAVELEGGDDYLKSELVAGNQVFSSLKTAIGTVSNGGSFKFPSSFWQENQTYGFPAFGQDNPDRYLIFEATGSGKGKLVMTFWKDGSKIGEGASVWLLFNHVRKMYERAKATPDSIDAPQDSTSTPSTPSVGYVLDPWNNQWEYPAVSWPETKDYVVFVHGWNTPYNSARTKFADTMFKRMWQRGYKGRFAALYWPTLVGLSTYNESEYRAWFYGGSLKQYVESLPADYTKNLVAHSMGNIVAGAALRKGLSIDNYALVNAAVPAICYDSNLQASISPSPDNDADQATRNLAYIGKLENVSGTLSNFFLASDDALETWEFNNQLYKPNGFGNPGHTYEYVPSNSTNEKLLLKIYSNNRFLEQLEESLSYAARSSTITVGALGETGGVVIDSIDLNLFGIEDEHSSFWAFTIQTMKSPYDSLMESLQLNYNP